MTGRAARGAAFAGLVLLAASFALWMTARGEPTPSPSGVSREDPRRDAPERAAGKAPRLATPASGAVSAKGAAPAAATEVEKAPRTHVVARVVGERRRPVADAEVRLLGAEGAPLVATSGADGAVAFYAALGEGEWRPLALHARRGDLVGYCEVGVVVPSEAGTTVDVGTVDLGPSAELRVRTIAFGSGPQSGVEVSVSVTVSFSMVSLATARTDDDGTATFEGLPPRWVHVRARAADGRLGSADAVPGEDPEPLDVPLREPRSLTVIVSEDGTDGPVAGADVLVWVRAKTEENFETWARPEPPVAAPPTDATGRTTLRGLCASDDLRVRASAPTHPGGAEREVKPGEGEVLLYLGRPRTVSFPLEPGEVAAPPDGAALVVREWPGAPELPPRSVVKGGAIVVEGARGGDAKGFAVAPDGSIAELHATEGRSTGAPTSFRRARRVEVLVRDGEGRALSGVGVQLRTEDGPPGSETVRTGMDGIAVLEGLPARSFQVQVGITALNDWGFEAGGVDLAAGDAREEVTLGPERDALVLVRVNGEPSLPRDLELTWSGAMVLASQEDPERGLVRQRLRLRGAASVEISVAAHAIGFERTAARLVWGAPGEPGRATLDLVRKATLVARVVGRPGVAETFVSVQAQDPETSRWTNRSFSLPFLRSPGEHRLSLEAGTWRLLDVASGLATEAVVLAAGATRELSLDLSGVREVTGRVRVPDGYFAGDAKVSSEGFGIDSAEASGRRVKFDGTFTVAVPGGRPVTVRVSHPELEPDPKTGSATIGEPVGELVLTLVEKTVATMRLLPPPGVVLEGDEGRVTLSADAAGKEPTQHPLRLLGDGSWRFAGFPPGRRTVVVELDGLPPRAVGPFDLPLGRTALGEVVLERGSTVTVRLLTKEGAAPPEVSGTLETRVAPVYARAGVQDGAALVFRGLGAGAFHASFSWETPDGRERSVERDVTVDGRTDAAIDLDVR